MANHRNPLVDVYAIEEEGEFIVRVKTDVEDTCLCVCNGKWEADVVIAMVRASAWNTTCQQAHSIAEEKLTGFLRASPVC